MDVHATKRGEFDTIISLYLLAEGGRQESFEMTSWRDGCVEILSTVLFDGGHVAP
ncbi:hypothetical protein J2129_001183 [Methanofollis sp. W23]|uniref:hypothetical protein n=1 Tax=Methanofollis sp. W23 TaxID=2817849 RepID=UPI001AE9F6C8|nr:hypothetical protein [Methanofollis sp. W23]MBP2145729.1 hypothetical protein [Methanofollis sp. W23]